MRLTLRTLLAYLDNTLEPQDAQVIRDKLSESGFATQLVQRIRDTLSSPSLPAPSPQAVGPVEEANVISEYLDSTLSSEQVAEIERACLESDPHLAEAAACHQVLTMVLGQAAEVSPELRDRIYQLPEENIEDVVSMGSFSSVSIPDASGADSLPGSIDADYADLGEPVKPVGIEDSGVSDAATRLRELEEDDGEDPSKRRPAAAGSTLRSAERATMIYGRSIRPSRIAPWLVSFALVAALLYFVAQIFAPLLSPASVALQSDGDAAEQSTDPMVDPSASADEVEVSAGDSPPMTEIASPETDKPLDTETVDPTTPPQESDTLPPPTQANVPAEADTRSADAEPASSDAMPEQSDTPDPANAPGQPNDPGQPSAPAQPDTPIASGESPSVASDRAAKGQPADASVLPASPDDAPVNPAEMDAGKMEPESVKSAGPPAVEADDAAPAVAKVTSSDSLLAALGKDQEWVKLQKDMPIAAGVKVICAPTYRGKLESIANVTITMVGASQIQWSQDSDALALEINFGRVVVQATKPNVSLDVILGDYPVTLTFADVETVVAASVDQVRTPGVDPLSPKSRARLASLTSLDGEVKLGINGTESTLSVDGQWIKRGDAEPLVSPAESAPNWVAPPDPEASTLESGARANLLAILEAKKSLELSLREATTFRMAEVGAIAGQTLLVMGQPDVYFGGDGILSQASQRLHWPAHTAALLNTVDRSVEDAQRVNQSIASMDAANTDPLVRLLMGYSAEQLAQGGDEELVQLLNSPSMAVRVLALGNLYEITGKTLYFKADQDNAIRRDSGIKKWEVLQRKGDIRWPK